MRSLVLRLVGATLLLAGVPMAWAQGSPQEGVADLRDVQLDWSRSQRPSLERGSQRPTPLDRGDASGRDDAKSAVAQLWAISLQDKTLYRVMRRWAAQAQYQLVWQVDRDFPIESEVVFEGSFRHAVGQVMFGVAETDFPLQAVFNSDARTLRVVRFLEERESRR